MNALVSRRNLLSFGGAMAAAACSPLAPLNWVAEGAGRRRVDISYGSAPRQQLDLYAPTRGGISAVVKRPLRVLEGMGQPVPSPTAKHGP